MTSCKGQEPSLDAFGELFQAARADFEVRPLEDLHEILLEVLAIGLELTSYRSQDALRSTKVKCLESLQKGAFRRHLGLDLDLFELNQQK